MSLRALTFDRIWTTVFNRRLSTLLLAALLCAGMAAGTVQAQEATKPAETSSQTNPSLGWMGVAVGGTASGGTMVVFRPFTYQHNRHRVSLHVLGAVQDRPSDTYFGPETHAEVGLLYGRAVRAGSVTLAASGGVGVGSRIGIPLEGSVHVAVPSLPWVGVEINLYANLNRESPFAGATLGLVVGRVRR